MKTLIIAEKPSVAQDIARALKVKMDGDVYENEQHVVAAAAGHLVGLVMPEDIDKKKYGFWRLSELPILPEKFDLKPLEEKGSKERFALLKKQLKRKDITTVLNACDAGREGELIFTYIYDLVKCKVPFKRVWMQSMTRDAILEAIQNPRTAEQMAGLRDAAKCRSEADWLVGINGTRAITKRLMGRGSVATVGRVQTPTLSIVVEREREIRDFKPRAYYRLRGDFAVAAGEYTGYFKKPEKLNKADEHDKTDRVWDRAQAEAIVETAQRLAVATVEDAKKRTRQSCPLLYDLTSLQREANGRFGLSASRTLQVAQALYEKHKVLTYPRTDSRMLPEDYLGTVRHTLDQFDGEYREHAQAVLAGNGVKPNKRIFNNAKVSDHFAIIPTGILPKKLSEIEAKVYDMVVRRFIAIFHPPAEFDETNRTTRLDQFEFVSKGKVLVKPGWMAVYGRAQLDNQLPELSEPDKQPNWPGAQPLPAWATASGLAHFAQPTAVEAEEEQTKPPARYTEATLLSAMETAGKLVDDEELAEAMKEKGLGTPATRASTIEHLIREKYMEREGKSLLPTAKAETLYDFVHALGVETLTSPAMTGEWEHQLLQMERGQLPRGKFMDAVVSLTKEVVEKTKAYEEDDDAQETHIMSPSDEKPLLETLRTFKSQDGVFTVYKTISGRQMQPEEVGELLAERRLGPLDGFRSKAGKPFSGMLVLDPMNKVKFDFGPKEGENEDGELDLSTLPVVGEFKATGAKVYATPSGFADENNLKGDKDHSFRMSRTMLEKTITENDVRALLENGKTELIKGFKSKRTGRLFDAFLVLKANGGIGFEFPPRPAKKATKKAAKKAARKG